ncbi:MAG: hypothetical protein AB7Q97_12390 [Gammaproteobacteria bacterium]
MHKDGNPGIVAVALSLIVALPCFAAYGATYEAYAEVDWESGYGFASDSRGPESSAALVAEAAVSQGLAQASVDPGANVALKVEGISAGGNVWNVLTARVLWVLPITNTTQTYQHYRATVSLPAISLEIPTAVTSLEPRNTARYQIRLDIDGRSVFSSSATLLSGARVPGARELIRNGTELDPIFVPALVPPLVDFLPYVGVVDIGDYAPGRTFTASYHLEVGIEFPGLEAGAFASIGDPSNPQGGSVQFVSEPSPVPLPGAFMPFAAAAAALAAHPRRSSRKPSSGATSFPSLIGQSDSGKMHCVNIQAS